VGLRPPAMHARASMQRGSIKAHRDYRHCQGRIVRWNAFRSGEQGNDKELAVYREPSRRCGILRYNPQNENNFRKHSRRPGAPRAKQNAKPKVRDA